MSIPPLVCSTPPPPDQCEEDKDTEDFDVHYNLSHSDDEDSNDYNYGNFSTYNQTESPSTQINQKVDILNTVEIQNSEADTNEGTNDSSKIKKLSNEEDINIEDLNLRVDENEPLDLNIKDDPGENRALGDLQDAVADIANIPCNIISDDVNNCTLPSPEAENNESNSTDYTKSEEIFSVEIVEDHSNVKNTQANEVNLDDEHERNKVLNPACSKDIEMLNVSSVLKEEDLSEDDFDDFQFISSGKSIDNSSHLEILNTCDNPWGNEELTNSDFGNFAANFEDNSSQQNNVSQIEFSEDQSQAETSNEAKNEHDDFGEFDGFKSSAFEVKDVPQEILVFQQVPVLNLQSGNNESEVIESMNKMLSSIFEEEVSESEEVFQGKLDLLLSETWGHLMDTDVRQPYIVNWNKSLAQKTLLKALCIDSRNILYGPKWSYNMPKYAANLSTAPLLPQKQSTSCSNSQDEVANAEKDSSKTTTWTDPFASNGQEFTYAEALLLDLEHLMATLDQMAHNHSTLKISELLSHACSTENENTVIEPGPTDLDVFEGTMATKSDKIYSSTLSVQPIRQINLPDTHIFTPTDSETPRSKTIHYDSGPTSTVLMSQPVDSFKSDSDKPSSPDLNNVNKLDSDSEYWEFQDFKGTINGNKIPHEKKDTTDTSNNSASKANVVYQTQLLQPIKLDPILPTLNWPDPGEVKETFEDFTDFISSSVKNSDEQNTVPTSIENIKTNIDFNTDPIINKVISNVQSTTHNVKFEDEFDTFQSALPSNKNTLFDANFANVSTNIVSNNQQSQNISSQARMTDFDVAFPNNIKADNISFKNSRTPIVALSQVTDSNAMSKDFHRLTPATSSGMTGINTLLQPTPVNVTGQTQPTSTTGTLPHQQTTTQILQPLSLESYSQINWPNPGIDLQDLSRFNPVETLPSLKSDLSASSQSKVASPVHNQKNVTNNQVADDDIWGEFVSSKPKQLPSQTSKKPCTFNDDDEWTDFVSSAVVKPQNGLNTISFNVHTNLTMQKSTNQSKFTTKSNSMPLDIPSLNYITPKTGNQKSYNDKHFQNL